MFKSEHSLPSGFGASFSHLLNKVSLTKKTPSPGMKPTDPSAQRSCNSHSCFEIANFPSLISRQFPLLPTGLTLIPKP